MALTLVNPTDRNWTRFRYVFAFGATGSIHCLVWANSLNVALDVCVDWLAEHAPGLLADVEVKDEYERGLAEGLGEHAATERAEIDTTMAGNEGHYLHSWEWTIVAQNPDRLELKSLIESLGGVSMRANAGGSESE